MSRILTGDTMIFSYKKTAAVVIAFTLILTIILILIYYRNPREVENKYILKEYNGTVALFKNDEVISVYDEIVLSAFPSADRQRFAEGIAINSPEEAEYIIEDFDG